MAPLRLMMRAFSLSAPIEEFREQGTRPGDVFSVLLLLGGDVVSRALAQLAGSRLVPVTFSFGWVAYAVAAIVSCVGENRLMPTAPDCTSIVINAKNGYVRSNSSWILGRMIRDYDTWMPPQARARLDKTLDDAHRFDQSRAKEGEVVPRPTRAGLMVSVFRASKVRRAGEPDIDAVWASGIVVAIIQLGVSCIPFGLFGDWGILLITICGIILCFITGSLPQWRAEKWSCRTDGNQNYVLTRGNGAQHAVVVLGCGHGLNFEDLAASDTNTGTTTSMFTRVALLVLAFFWIALLIFAAGLRDNTWFLLAVGGLGIVHNAAVAGWPRKPSSFGIHLEDQEFITGPRVMPVLMETERRYPHVGKSMLPTFFPGRLWPEEENEWKLLDLEATAHDAEEKARNTEHDLETKRNHLDTSLSEKEAIQAHLAVVDAEHKARNAQAAAHNKRQIAQDARRAAENIKKAGHAMTL